MIDPESDTPMSGESGIPPHGVPGALRVLATGIEEFLFVR